MTLPTVSILCSSYNASRWIDAYCRSLNAQLLGDFDVVFVDAASTDDSLERFRNFGFRAGIRTRIIECPERLSVYAAWNLAIEACQGDYVMNFNTDDRLYPAALTTLLAYAGAFPDADVIYSRCMVVDDAGHTRIVNLQDWPEYSHEQLLKLCICGPFPLLKRKTLLDAGLFDSHYSIVGDYEMWLRLSKLGRRFMKVPEIIGSYYFNPAGLSTDHSLASERTRQVAEIQAKYR